MEEVLSDETRISKSDIKYVFEAIYKNYESDLDILLTFFNENMEELNDKYGDILQIDEIILEAAMNILTKEQLWKVNILKILF